MPEVKDEHFSSEFRLVTITDLLKGVKLRSRHLHGDIIHKLYLSISLYDISWCKPALNTVFSLQDAGCWTYLLDANQCFLTTERIYFVES